MADRRYDEKEVGAILQRASEIQSGMTPQGTSDGLTLGDLQKVAAEVGIEPAVVERAASEIGTTVTDGKLRSGTNTILLDRTVDGVVTEEAWDEMVTRLRRHVGKPGRINAHGHTYEWWGGWDTGGLMLTTTTRNGKTRFKLMGETTGGAVLAWTLGPCIGLMAALFTGVAIDKGGQPSWIALSVALMVMVFTFVATSLGLRAWRQKSRVGMEQVFDDVAALVDRSPEAVPMEPALIVAPEEEEQSVFHT